MAKAAKPVKKETLVVTSKIYKLIKSQGLRVGGDFVAALSEKVHVLVGASIQKVQSEGKKKTLNQDDLI